MLLFFKWRIFAIWFGGTGEMDSKCNRGGMQPILLSENLVSEIKISFLFEM